MERTKQPSCRVTALELQARGSGPSLIVGGEVARKIRLQQVSSDPPFEPACKTAANSVRADLSADIERRVARLAIGRIDLQHCLAILQRGIAKVVNTLPTLGTRLDGQFLSCNQRYAIVIGVDLNLQRQQPLQHRALYINFGGRYLGTALSKGNLDCPDSCHRTVEIDRQGASRLPYASVNRMLLGQYFDIEIQQPGNLADRKQGIGGIAVGSH